MLPIVIALCVLGLLLVAAGYLVGRRDAQLAAQIQVMTAQMKGVEAALHALATVQGAARAPHLRNEHEAQGRINCPPR